MVSNWGGFFAKCPNGDKPDKNGIGEIVVSTPALFSEYYDNKDATNEVLKKNWFYTGDLGYIDKDGFLFITRT